MRIIKHYQGYKPYHVKYAEEHPEREHGKPDDKDTNAIILGYALIVSLVVISLLVVAIIG